MDDGAYLRIGYAKDRDPILRLFLKPVSGDSKAEGQVCMLHIRHFGDPTKQETIDAALRVFVPLAEQFQNNDIPRDQL